jgi:TnpA family transposase
MFMEETPLCAARNQPLQTCPEALSAINTTHYHHVLRICRRFFRQPENTEDAAAELLQDRTRTEKAPSYGPGDDLPSQGATSPQFATRAVCV